MKTGGFVVTAMLAAGLLFTGCSDSQPGQIAGPPPPRTHSTDNDPVECAQLCDRAYGTCAGAFSAEGILGGDEGHCFHLCEAGEIDYNADSLTTGSCDDIADTLVGENVRCTDPFRCAGEAHALFGE